MDNENYELFLTTILELLLKDDSHCQLTMVMFEMTKQILDETAMPFSVGI